jgi:hypothetical protein
MTMISLNLVSEVEQSNPNTKILGDSNGSVSYDTSQK